MLSNNLFRLSGVAFPESRASKAWTPPGSDWSRTALERSTSVLSGNNSVGRRPSVVVNGLDKPLKTARADSDITPRRISFKRSTNSATGDTDEIDVRSGMWIAITKCVRLSFCRKTCLRVTMFSIHLDHASLWKAKNGSLPFVTGGNWKKSPVTTSWRHESTLQHDQAGKKWPT